MRYVMPIDERIALVQTTVPITLDGNKAKVCGYRNEFATINSKEGSVQFAWATVKRIVESHGEFKS